MLKSPQKPLRLAASPASGAPATRTGKPAASSLRPADSTIPNGEAMSAVMGLTPITDKEFEAFRDLIYRECNIHLRETKKALLVSRLGRRIKNLGLKTFSDYYKYLTDGPGKGAEFMEMIDAVTTNKTSFFREPHHFDYMRNVIIPELRDTHQLASGRSFRVWSAGCSTGEEPYTISMSLNEELQTGESFSIQASDLSPSVLAHARNGIYKPDRIGDIPPDLLRKYFLKGEDSYRVRPELQKNITFKQINLTSNFVNDRSLFNLIFCRNVIIYFDREAQRTLMEKFYRSLVPGGHLFLGHSESLNGVFDKFKFIRASVYRKDRERER